MAKLTQKIDCKNRKVCYSVRMHRYTVTAILIFVSFFCSPKTDLDKLTHQPWYLSPDDCLGASFAEYGSILRFEKDGTFTLKTEADSIDTPYSIKDSAEQSGTFIFSGNSIKMKVGAYKLHSKKIDIESRKVVEETVTDRPAEEWVLKYGACRQNSKIPALVNPANPQMQFVIQPAKG